MEIRRVQNRSFYAGAHVNVDMLLYHHGNSCYGSNILKNVYLYNGNPYTWKIVFILKWHPWLMGCYSIVTETVLVMHKEPWDNYFHSMVYLDWVPDNNFMDMTSTMTMDGNVSENIFQSFIPDSKVHGVYMGPTWGRQNPGGSHVGPMILAI